MPTLIEDLTRDQLRALEILNTGPHAEIEPVCPAGLRAAMFQLLSVGLATCSTQPLQFRITVDGKKVADQVAQ